MTRQAEGPKKLSNLMATATSQFMGSGEVPMRRSDAEPHNGPLTKICQKMISSQFMEEKDNANIHQDIKEEHYESVFSRFLKQ